VLLVLLVVLMLLLDVLVDVLLFVLDVLLVVLLLVWWVKFRWPIASVCGLECLAHLPQDSLLSPHPAALLT